MYKVSYIDVDLCNADIYQLAAYFGYQFDYDWTEYAARNRKQVCFFQYSE